MSFLNPLAIAVAAGLTIPPLVALYFLKLKRSVKVVPSTLLWKRAVEDLQVNSPFQRLRSSLLLLLQLLLLVLAAIALGKPMFKTAERREDNIILLMDQSASMGVIEEDGATRLEKAKEQAKRCIDDMDNDTRAMIVAFCDRAIIIASFDTDKEALKRKIDAIEQTQSTSTLTEAMSLAEAYAQNMIIGGEEAGRDLVPEAAASPASVYLFTDGRIEDSEQISLQRFDLDSIHVTSVGSRTDNVGMIAMDARRHYDSPEILEVTATVQNFGSEAVSLDAVLYVDGENVDIKTLRLEPAVKNAEGAEETSTVPTVGAIVAVSFDEIEFSGSGVVEVRLRIDDGLAADNRAWTVIEEPRHVSVLLVSDELLFLDDVLSTLPLELTTMSRAEYEAADEQILNEGERSAFDVVVFDRHSTDKLPQGNYLFFGGIPQIDGVSVQGVIGDEVIFNWDETHAVLRHVAVETLNVFDWLKLELPADAVLIIEGQSSAVLAYLPREASQYLISAFGLVSEDETGTVLYNTDWFTKVDFVVFMQNAVQYLSSSISTKGRRGALPGEPVTVPIPERVEEVTVLRPDGTNDSVPSAGYQTIHYARTRQVGTYRLEPAVPGAEIFTVNLFNSVESQIAPAGTIALGADRVKAEGGDVEVNEPAWQYILLGVLVLLVVEWVVYNQRIFV